MDDRGHLEHVLAGAVDERVVGVELALAHTTGKSQSFSSSSQDRLGTFDRAPVGQLTVFVVGQLDVLGRTECLQ